jgi:hypothetical protein
MPTSSASKPRRRYDVSAELELKQATNIAVHSLHRVVRRQKPPIRKKKRLLCVGRSCLHTRETPAMRPGTVSGATSTKSHPQKIPNETQDNKGKVRCRDLVGAHKPQRSRGQVWSGDGMCDEHSITHSLSHRTAPRTCKKNMPAQA